MKTLLAVLILCTGLWATDSTRRVSEATGATVSERVTNLQTDCAAIAPETCYIIFDRGVPKTVNESLPAPCANCVWIDERIPIAIQWGDVTGAPAFAQTLTCPGTDKIKAFDALTGTFTCAADEGGAGGGVTSFNARTGAVTPDSADYASFYATSTHNHDWGGSDILNKPTIPNVPTCSGTDKVTANGTSFSCATDQTGSGSSSSTFLRVTGAEYTNSTTGYTTVTGLSTTLSANTVYNFRCNLLVSAAGTTTGVQVAVSYSATSNYLRWHVRSPTSATALANHGGIASETVNTGALPTASSGTTVTMMEVIGMVDTNANAGTFAIRAKSEVASSAITVYRGSHCEVF